MRGEHLFGRLLRVAGDPLEHQTIGLSAVAPRSRLSPRALQAANHLVEPDLASRPGQQVTSVWAPDRADKPRAPQGHQHLVEKRARDALTARDLAALQGSPAVESGELHDGPDPVLSLHRKSHAHRLTSENVERASQVYGGAESAAGQPAGGEGQEQGPQEYKRDRGRQQAETPVTERPPIGGPFPDAPPENHPLHRQEQRRGPQPERN